jgi:hypothetical protein
MTLCKGTGKEKQKPVTFNTLTEIYVKTKIKKIPYVMQ